MNLQESIKKILKEDTEDMSPLERTVADFVNMNLRDYELPEEFYKVAVDVFDDGYGRQECTITSLFEKPFKLDDSDRMHFIMNKIKREINDYFGNVFSHIAFGSSTVSNYEDTRDWYTKRKNKKLNESENKKKSLFKNISDVGLYDFIKMTGIELIELKTQIGQIPREMLEQFIKDYISNEGHQYSSAIPDEKIVSIDVIVGGNAIIDFMYYDGKLLSFEVTEYANGFSKEETDQYIEGAKNYEYETIFKIVNKITRKITN
jgi:hypothetical protein